MLYFWIFFGNFQKQSEKISNYAIFLDFFWKFPNSFQNISKLCYIFGNCLEISKKNPNYAIFYFFEISKKKNPKNFQTMLYFRFFFFGNFKKQIRNISKLCYILIFFGKFPNYAIFLDFFWKFLKNFQKISKLCYILSFFF